MSLTDLEHQIKTADLVSAKLVEDDAKSAAVAGGFSSLVRSGIRKEFSAFRKVLENSKSRLKELQEMQQALDDMKVMDEPENIPRTITTVTKKKSPKNDESQPAKNDSPKKTAARSPHWLPALGKKKKFFREEEEVDESRDDNAEKDDRIDLEERENDEENRDNDDDGNNRREEPLTQSKELSEKIREEFKILPLSEKIRKGKIQEESKSLPLSEKIRKEFKNLPKLKNKSTTTTPDTDTDRSCEDLVVPKIDSNDSKNPDSQKARDWDLAIESIQDEFTVTSQSGPSRLDGDNADVGNNSGPSSADGDNADVGNKCGNDVPGQGPSLSLAAREQSFRSNLQARAFAMSQHSRTWVPQVSIMSNPERLQSFESENSNSNTRHTLANEGEGSAYSGESAEGLATRLEKSIRLMTTTELIAGAAPIQHKASQLLRSGVVSLPDLMPEGVAEAEKPEDVLNEIRRGKPVPLFKRMSTLTLKHLKFPSQKSPKTKKQERDDLSKGHFSSNPEGEPQDTMGAAADNQFYGSNPQSSTNAARQQLHVSKVQPGTTLAREQSFQAEGWKQKRSDNQLVKATEEAIAANELKAREAYIRAMQAHQKLLRTGTDETSHRVIKSQKNLQAIFQKIEYWEQMREKFKSNPDSFSPSDATEKHGSPPAQPEDKNGQDGGGESKISATNDPDACYVGEQERKAREAYIKAMRHHQDLVRNRVKQDSIEWIESQTNQEKCLATLKYWEAKSVELEARTQENSSANGSHVGRVGSVNKPVYKVSQENREDQKGRESLIESLAKSVHAKYFKQESNLSKAELPKDVLSSNESDLSQLDENGILSIFEMLVSSIMPFCIDSGCIYPPSSDIPSRDPTTGSNNNAKKRPKVSKASNERRTNNASRSSKVNRKTSKTTKPRKDTMNVIESEAKEILGHLSVAASGSDEVMSAISNTRANQERKLHDHTRQHHRQTPKGGTHKHRIEEEADDRSQVQKLIDEEGGHLFWR